MEHYAANGGCILDVYACAIWIHFKNKIIGEKVRMNEI